MPREIDLQRRHRDVALVHRVEIRALGRVGAFAGWPHPVDLAAAWIRRTNHRRGAMAIIMGNLSSTVSLNKSLFMGRGRSLPGSTRMRRYPGKSLYGINAGPRSTRER